MAEVKQELLELLKTRRSIRKYKPDMVPKEVIDQIIQAGTYAASGMGRQSPIILAVTDRGIRDRLSRLNGWETAAIPFTERRWF